MTVQLLNTNISWTWLRPLKIINLITRLVYIFGKHENLKGGTIGRKPTINFLKTLLFYQRMLDKYIFHSLISLKFEFKMKFNFGIGYISQITVMSHDNLSGQKQPGSLKNKQTVNYYEAINWPHLSLLVDFLLQVSLNLHLIAPNMTLLNSIQIVGVVAKL